MKRNLLMLSVIMLVAWANSSFAQSPSLEDTIGYLNSYLDKSWESIRVVRGTEIEKEGQSTFDGSPRKWRFDLEQINAGVSWKEEQQRHELTLGCKVADCVKYYINGSFDDHLNEVKLDIELDKRDSAQKALEHIFQNIIGAEPDPFGD